MDQELQELYQEIILDYSKHPRNFRVMADANGQAEGNNPTCGDRVKVYIKTTKDGHISDVSFEGSGCAISQASASIMTEILKNKTLKEAYDISETFRHICTGEALNKKGHSSSLSEEDMEKLKLFGGVKSFPLRIKCATMAWHAVTAAISNSAH